MNSSGDQKKSATTVMTAADGSNCIWYYKEYILKFYCW